MLYNKKNKNIANEVTESFFPAPLTESHEQEKLESFREYRQQMEPGRTVTDKLIVQLLQLKYLMEDCIALPGYDDRFRFGYFLKEYIHRLGKKDKDFATEVGVEPSMLSHLLNGHRKPNEEFLIRLEIHSNKGLPAITWYKLLEKERAYGIVNNLEMRNLEKKHVKNKLEFSF